MRNYDSQIASMGLRTANKITKVENVLLFEFFRCLFQYALTHKATQAALSVVLPGFIILTLSGCGQTNSPVENNETPVEVSPPPKPHKPPDLSAIQGFDPNAAVADNFIQQPAPGSQPKRVTYVQDEKWPSGSLKGVCRFTKGNIQKPAPVQIDTNKQILNPKPRELEFYSMFKYYTPDWIGKGGEVCGAVVLIRGIKIGSKPVLDCPPLLIFDGGFSGGDRVEIRSKSPFSHYFLLNINNNVLFANCDPFECDLAIQSVGINEEICHTLAPPATHTYEPGETLPEPTDAWNKHKKDNTINSPKWYFVGGAKRYPSKRIKESGYYFISCKIHPWQKTCLIAVDNPYVALPTDGLKNGSFMIAKIPPGKHTVEIWHPVYKPVQATYEIEIKENEETSLVVQFEPPPDVGSSLHERK